MTIADSTASERLIDGRYRLHERIGAGGTAEVYRATDTRLDRSVAVKLLSPGLAGDPSFVERFRREAGVLAQMKHPNLVAVYDCGETDGQPFLVMELIRGSDLRHLLRSRGRVPEHEALALIEAAARGLQAAHERGIVHRDVKPHNILLDDNGQVHVADFGVARSVEAGLSSHSGLVGTAYYLAPEQVRGEAADYRSDVYSLGVVLYELLVGRPPFDGDDPVAVALKHTRSAVPPAPKDISAATRAIIARALSKRRERRFATMAALADALAGARGRAHPVADPAIDLAATRAITVPRHAMGPPASDGDVHSEAAVAVGDAATAGTLPGALEATSRSPLIAAAPAGPSSGDSVRRRKGGAAVAGRPRPLLWASGVVVFLLLLGLARAWDPPWGGRSPVRATAVAAAVATPAPASATPAGLFARAFGGRTTPAQPCTFVLGFKQLREKIPTVVGDCVENERHDPSSGDAIQRTTRGVLVWRKSDGVSAFSDGQRTWVDGPRGLQERAATARFDWER